MNTFTRPMSPPAARRDPATREAARLVLAATGTAILTTTGLGYWIVLARGALPDANPWPLVGLCLLGITCWLRAMRAEALDLRSWLIVVPGLCAALVWFSTVP